ncbi:hypothetical protein [Modestobacter caceresii]|uniref:hypothetical protein n=1 Tax=Modestobacter caceresii TaxID=1522368 RepID=UPI00068A743A|nr:hypothetical protein [Modestobacter caceresii]
MHVTVVGSVLLLAYGTAVHVVHLALGGLDPYPGLPDWLAGYFIGLTVVDPLAAVLLWRGRRSGVLLTVAVFVTDAAANGWANHVLDPSGGVTAGRVGQAVITALALALLVMTPRLWRHAGGG